jgi:hypothetical protein
MSALAGEPTAVVAVVARADETAFVFVPLESVSTKPNMTSRRPDTQKTNASKKK